MPIHPDDQAFYDAEEQYYQNIRDLEDERDRLDDAPDWPPYAVCSVCGPLDYIQSQSDHGECGEFSPPRYVMHGPDRGLPIAEVEARNRGEQMAHAGFRAMMREALVDAPEQYRYDASDWEDNSPADEQDDLDLPF